MGPNQVSEGPGRVLNLETALEYRGVSICEKRKPFNRKAEGGVSLQLCEFFAAAVERRCRGS